MTLNIQKEPVFIYLYSEDQLYIKDLLDQFREKSNYQVANYISHEELLESIPSVPLKKRGTHLVILVFNFDKSTLIDNKNALEYLHDIKLKSNEIEIILLSRTESIEAENIINGIPGVTLVVKNENAIVRLDNHIKRIKSQTILEKKRKRFHFWRNIFLLSLVLLAVFIIYGLLTE